MLWKEMKSMLALLLFAVGVSGYGQSAGTFTSTGSMTVARTAYTATLLPNGRVLIAGGYYFSAIAELASAELYDPSTGAFIPTGDMTTARAYHSATLLPDGRVLIAGGSSSNVAELYDPSTRTFTTTGDMVNGGYGTAILLADGKVLIAHPRLPFAAAATAELYDPATGTFSATGDQLLSGAQQAALLADGRVLLMICCTVEQLYNPASGTFSLTGRTTRVYEDGFAAAPLANGKVLLSGGYTEEGYPEVTAGAELYDPGTGTFVPTGNMTVPRYYHTATPLGDGTVLIAGSQVVRFVDIAIASAELYDPATGTFSRTGDMTTARFGHTATLLLDGTVLIAGGWGLGGQGLASAELYKPPAPVPAPVLFSLSGDGRGQGAIWHAATGEIASAANPAVAGEALSVYTTSLAPGGVIPPQVSIGGRLGEILYFGDAPGYPGYYQVNFRVPDGVMAGDSVPVRLTYIGRPSNAVTIGVR
jgi:hypothetical protein